MTDESLSGVRDMLLPALWIAKTDDIAIEIVVDSNHESLVVKGYNRKLKRSLGFAITKERIKDKAYEATFKPSLDSLIKQLS